MGPLFTVLIREYERYLEAGAADAAGLGGAPEQGMTPIQIRSLNHVSKGNIRPAADHFLLVLKEGVFGRGGELFQARFSPISLRSRRNAEVICREVARGRYRFDLLFVDDGIRGERLKVLCPRCRQYWDWHEQLPNDIARTVGRVCRYCGGK